MSRTIRAKLLTDSILLAIGYAFIVAHTVPWEVDVAVGEKASAQGNTALGEQALRNAIEKAEEVAPEAPRLAAALSRLGNLLSDRGRLAEAEPLHLRALAIREKALGREHPDTAESFNDLALLYRAQGWDAAAEPLLLEAIAIRRKTLDPTNPLIAESLRSLAGIEANTDRYTEARRHYEHALEIVENALGPKHPRVRPILNGLALLEASRGRPLVAEGYLRRALETASAASVRPGKMSSWSMSTLDALELAGHALGWSLAPESRFGKALTSAQKALEPKSHELAAIHSNLGIVAFGFGRRAEAEDYFRQALRIEDALDSPGRLAARIHFNLGRLYFVQGRNDEAKMAYEQALRIANRVLRSGHPFSSLIARNLASLPHNDSVIAAVWQQGF